MLKKLLMMAVGGAFIALGVAQASQAATLKVIASGLDSPRKISFGADGTLYVTEAGKGGNGPCIQDAEQPTNKCYGSTGAITRLQNGTQQRIVTGLPSLAAADGSDATGADDIKFDSSGKAYVLVGFGEHPSDRATLGDSNFAQLLTINNINGGGAWTKLADLTTVLNPGADQNDPNPYGLLLQGNTALIADAGENDVLSVQTNGTNLTLKSVFDERNVPNPFGNPATIGMESVPTTIVTGPDGALYVGELTGFPFPTGGARIYRIGSDNQPVLYADGFTNITDMAFDNKGGLYVLEYAKNSILSGDNTGALIYLAPDGTRTTIASNGLINPNGLALGSDGTIYVTNNTFLAGQGQVVSISVPEPSSLLGLLAVSAGSTVSLIWRKSRVRSEIKNA